MSRRRAVSRGSRSAPARRAARETATSKAGTQVPPIGRPAPVSAAGQVWQARRDRPRTCAGHHPARCRHGGGLKDLPCTAPRECGSLVCAAIAHARKPAFPRTRTPDSRHGLRPPGMRRRFPAAAHEVQGFDPVAPAQEVLGFGRVGSVQPVTRHQRLALPFVFRVTALVFDVGGLVALLVQEIAAGWRGRRLRRDAGRQDQAQGRQQRGQTQNSFGMDHGLPLFINVPVAPRGRRKRVSLIGGSCACAPACQPMWRRRGRRRRG